MLLPDGTTSDVMKSNSMSEEEHQEQSYTTAAKPTSSTSGWASDTTAVDSLRDTRSATICAALTRLGILEQEFFGGGNWGITSSEQSHRRREEYRILIVGADSTGEGGTPHQTCEVFRVLVEVLLLLLSATASDDATAATVDRRQRELSSFWRDFSSVARQLVREAAAAGVGSSGDALARDDLFKEFSYMDEGEVNEETEGTGESTVVLALYLVGPHVPRALGGKVYAKSFRTVCSSLRLRLHYFTALCTDVLAPLRAPTAAAAEDQEVLFESRAPQQNSEARSQAPASPQVTCGPPLTEDEREELDGHRLRMEDEQKKILKDLEKQSSEVVAQEDEQTKRAASSASVSVSSERSRVTGCENKEIPRDNLLLGVYFNAGVWGYETWMDTIRETTLLCPTLLTSYNSDEAEDDFDAMEAGFVGGDASSASAAAVVQRQVQLSIEGTTSSFRPWFGPEPNPWLSLVERTTEYSPGVVGVLRDNCMWQIWSSTLTTTAARTE